MTLSLLSVAYIVHASAHCFVLLMHCAPCALSFARDIAGNSIAAKIAIIAITTNNSISVKAPRWTVERWRFDEVGLDVFIQEL